MNNITERNAGIDLIKIFACMGVCSLHFYLRYMIKDPSFRWEYIIFYAAGMAIPLFFMVNGYLLLSKERPRSYYFKKILNIIKIVITVNVLWFILLFLLKREIQPNPLIESFKNLFLKEGFFSVFWFFGSLIIIYLLIAFIPYRLFTRKNYLYVILILVILQFLANQFNLVTYQNEQIFESHIIQTFRLYNHISYFLIGGLIRSFHNRMDICRLFCWGGVILCIASETYICNSIYDIDAVELLQCNFITTFGVVCFFCLLLSIKIRETYSKIIGKIGPTVLMVYIIHEAILPLFVVRDARFPLIYLLCFWICLFTISFCLTRIKLIDSYFKL